MKPNIGLNCYNSTDYLAENEFKKYFYRLPELTNILASKTMKETKILNFFILNF